MEVSCCNCVIFKELTFDFAAISVFVVSFTTEGESTEADYLGLW